MDLRAICGALLLSSLSVAGCGTVANLARSNPEVGARTPFGGVRQDVECYKTAANGEFGFRTKPRSESEQYPQVALMMFCAADLPLSLVGDVVTWPYTAAYSCINQPVPTPPLIQAMKDPPLQPNFGPANRPPEMLTPDMDAERGKPGDDTPRELPMPLPLPKSRTP